MEDRFGEYYSLTGLEAPRHCFWCGAEVDGRRRYCCEEHHELYLKHFRWPEASEWCLERYDFKCGDCPSDIRKMFARRVHHIEPLNGELRLWNIKNRPENLIALCASCHGKRHAKLKEPAPARLEREIARGQLVFPELAGVR